MLESNARSKLTNRTMPAIPEMLPQQQQKPFDANNIILNWKHKSNDDECDVKLRPNKKNHYFIGLNTTCFCLNWNQLWIEKCPKRLQVNGYWLALGNRLKIDKIPYQIGMMSQQPYCAYQFLCSLSPSSLSELFFSGNRFDRVPCFWKQEKAKENAILLNINDQISTTFFLINSSSSKFSKQ